MEFFIRKKSTLPILEVDLVKDGGLDFNYVNTNLNGDKKVKKTQSTMVDLFVSLVLMVIKG